MPLWVRITTGHTGSTPAWQAGGTRNDNSANGPYWQVNFPRPYSVNNAYLETYDACCGILTMDVRTTTDGINWTRSTIDTSYTLSAVFFVNNSRGYVCANHGPTADRTYILQTADGGASWILPTPTNGVYDDPRTLLSLYFISPDTGFAVGKFHRLLRTTNGGFTWGALPNPVRGSNHFLDVQFVNSLVGTVVGTSGTIIRTVDGGRTSVRRQRTAC